MTKTEFYSRLNHLLHRVGFDIRRFPTPNQRLLLKYLRDHNIAHCFDIGANIGQFAISLRSSGFTGKIYSFEPQKDAFNKLNRLASGDPFWKVFDIALGDTNETASINISKNSASSSLLERETLLEEAAPESDFVSQEIVKVKRLDAVLPGILTDSSKIFVKIDAQGFESKILNGAEKCFHKIYALQVELSFLPLYKTEKLFDEMKRYIESKGFYLSSLENGFSDKKTGRLFQVDAIFLRDVCQYKA